MAISDYLKDLRGRIGHRLLMVPSVAAMIFNHEGRILLQRTNEGWSLPAGAINPGETPAQAVIREVREQTGLQVRPQRVVGVFGGSDGFRFTYSNGDQVEYLCVLFECGVMGGEPGGSDDETVELHFFPVDQMPQLTVGYPSEIFTQSHREPYFQRSEHGHDRYE